MQVRTDRRPGFPTPSSHILEVVGYACAFLGVAGFYMSVVFYAISLILNVICTGELPQISCPLQSDFGVER